MVYFNLLHTEQVDALAGCLYLREITKFFLIDRNEGYKDLNEIQQQRIKDHIADDFFLNCWPAKLKAHSDAISSKSTKEWTKENKSLFQSISLNFKAYVKIMNSELLQNADAFPRPPNEDSTKKPSLKKQRLNENFSLESAKDLSRILKTSWMNVNFVREAEVSCFLPPPGYDYYFLDFQRQNMPCLISEELLVKIFSMKGNANG